MILLDSNVLIYSTQQPYIALRNWILSDEFAYSVISKVEVLGYWKMLPTHEQALRAYFRKYATSTFNRQTM